MSNSSTSGGGLSLASVLTIVFLILKLTHNIDWSWWWVLSPLWISFGLVFLLMLIAGVIATAKR